MRYRRTRIPGGTYFLTLTLADRTKSYLVEYITQLKSSINKVKERHPFKIDAIVILPDHLHVLITLPRNDSNYSMRVRLVKTYFSSSVVAKEKLSLGRKVKSKKNIWQRRFWEHAIRDEDDFEQHVNYIHCNPVKHGYVKRTVDWPYSSVHRYIRTDVLPATWAEDLPVGKHKFGE